MKVIKCRNCDFCKLIYRKWNYHYYRTDLRYCVFRDEFTQLENSCTSGCPKKRVYDLSASRFDSAENDVALLLEYLKDD
ncbi:MAG: hypothetical protein HFE47_07555 [Clostridia bacterium]|nr:hypothetical protein [Clostridia bacterium]